jgi:predicted nucleic acid-binding protein
VTGFAVDASVAIKWLVEEPGAELAALLLDHPLVAPDLLGPECANVLWKKVVRGELSAREAELMALALAGVDIALHPTRPYLQPALEAATALRHPAYDCIYLCLAEQLGQPLVTADQRLVATVRNAASQRFAGTVLPLAALPQVLASG